MNKLIDIFKNKPYLAWYLKDTASLSEKSLLEHILNYGNWEDYLLTEQTLGIKKAKQLFIALKNNNRVNLRDKTINYFEKYYQKYA
jgi:hypothetical protein